MNKMYICLASLLFFSCSTEIGHKFVLENNSSIEIRDVSLGAGFNVQVDTEGNITDLNYSHENSVIVSELALAAGELSRTYYWKAGENTLFAVLPAESWAKLTFSNGTTHEYFFKISSTEAKECTRIQFAENKVQISNSMQDDLLPYINRSFNFTYGN